MRYKGIRKILVPNTANNGENEPASAVNSLLDEWLEVSDRPFDAWVVSVNNAYVSSGLSLKNAARLLSIQPAELQAVTNLANLESEHLKLLSDLKPPNTTWFVLAAASPAALQAAVDALWLTKDKSDAFRVASEAIENVEGPGILTKVAGLKSEVFSYAAKKARQSDVLTPRQQKALQNFGTILKSGKRLTPKQLKYAADMLQMLADVAVIHASHGEIDCQIIQVLASD